MEDASRGEGGRCMDNDKWDPNRMFILVHRLAEQGAEGGDRLGAGAPPVW